MHDGTRATHRVALHAPRDRPPPGAARRPLPARERRLFVASLRTGGSFLSTHSTDLHPAGGRCRGDPMGRPLGASHVRSPGRFAAVPSCTIAPGRRTASPLQYTETRVWWGRACTPTACERDRHPTRQDQGRFANRPYRDAAVEPVVPWPGGARVLPASAPTVVQTC